MLKLSDIRKLFILSIITLMIMFTISMAVAGGHGGGMGMSSMGMSSMGGCCGGMNSYYGYGGYYPTTTASWLGGYTPYATTIGSPYSAYGYSPYNTRIGSLLGTSLGGYGGLYGYGGGVSNTYTTYVPGGQISTTVPASYGGYGYGLYGGGGLGLGGYSLGGGYGYNPYGYGIGSQWI